MASMKQASKQSVMDLIVRNSNMIDGVAIEQQVDALFATFCILEHEWAQTITPIDPEDTYVTPDEWVGSITCWNCKVKQI